MEKCDLDACSLKGDIKTIKNSQEKMQETHTNLMVVQGKLVEKIEGFMENSNEKHDALFERTKLVMKWPHFAMAIGAVSTLVGLIITISMLAGG